MIEFSDEMSPIDRIGGGDLDVVGIGVCGGTFLVDPVVLDIDPIIDYVTFEKAKGKEGFLHRVVHHVCYAQALGVVDVGSLSAELSRRIRVRSDHPSFRASQGRNHGVRRGCRGSREVRQSA